MKPGKLIWIHNPSWRSRRRNGKPIIPLSFCSCAQDALMTDQHHDRLNLRNLQSRPRRLAGQRGRPFNLMFSQKPVTPTLNSRGIQRQRMGTSCSPRRSSGWRVRSSPRLRRSNLELPSPVEGGKLERSLQLPDLYQPFRNLLSQAM